jgi:hypothetical protein
VVVSLQAASSSGTAPCGTEPVIEGRAHLIHRRRASTRPSEELTTQAKYGVAMPAWPRSVDRAWEVGGTGNAPSAWSSSSIVG